MTSEELLDLILELPVLELQAVVLMRQHHPAGTRPDAESVAAATTELIRYTGDCASIAEKVVKLPAVPWSAPVESYSL